MCPPEGSTFLHARSSEKHVIEYWCRVYRLTEDNWPTSTCVVVGSKASETRTLLLRVVIGAEATEAKSRHRYRVSSRSLMEDDNVERGEGMM